MTKRIFIAVLTLLIVITTAVTGKEGSVDVNSIDAAVAITRETAQAVDLAEQYRECSENAYNEKCELSTEPTTLIKDKGLCRQCGSVASYLSDHGTFCSIDCEYSWLCDNHIYCELCGTTDYTECQCGWLK